MNLTVHLAAYNVVTQPKIVETVLAHSDPTDAMNLMLVSKL